MSGVLYGAAVVQQWLAQQCVACVCAQQLLEQQQWVVPVR